ncbi:beta strand repeat-containing protein, partial [Flavobacterium sp.]|uniref:beta strand repeat-containing protein n=1 Tax=Flavobacterium sp. TaxID=239 RepID=UPI003F69D009
MKLKLFLFLFVLSFLGHAQDLTISSTGETGLSGANWTLSANVLNVTGNAIINPSVINGHLASNDLSIIGVSNLYVNGAISWSSNKSLTLNASQNILLYSDVTVGGSSAGLSLFYGGSNATTAPNSSYSCAMSQKNRNKISFASASSQLRIGNEIFTICNTLNQLSSVMTVATSATRVAIGANIYLSDTYSNALFNINFSGKFDGLGHVINGLKIRNSGGASSKTNLGLFAQLQGATVRNLGVTNVDILTNSTSAGTSGSEFRIGSLAGNIGNSALTTTGYSSIAYTTAIESVWSSGNIGTANNFSTDNMSSGDRQKFFFAGGLVGSVNNGTANISRCYSYTNVSSSGSYSDNIAIGGLIGDIGKNINLPVQHTQGTNADMVLNLNKSFTTGSVLSGTYGAYYGTGGVIGVLFASGSSVSNCYSWGSAVSTGSFGGLIGFVLSNSGPISNSYTTQSTPGANFNNSSNIYSSVTAVSPTSGTSLPTGFNNTIWSKETGKLPVLLDLETPPSILYVKVTTDQSSPCSAISVNYTITDASGNLVTLSSLGLATPTGTPVFTINNATPPGTYTGVSYLSGLTLTGANASSYTLNPLPSGVSSHTITGSCSNRQITFNGNTNTAGSSPANITFTTSATLPNQGSLEKTGYQFIGWNTAANGTGTRYDVNATYSVAADITLYAHWLNLSTLGDMTIVASGGSAEGSTWRFGNNSIYPISNTAVTINVSDVLSKMALGNLTIIGANINVNTDVVYATDSNSLTLKASGNIKQAAGVNITTDDSDVIFWSDADASGTASVAGGTIALMNASSIRTYGGNVVLAGGNDTNNDGIPDGYAIGAFATESRGAGLTVNAGLSMDNTSIDAGSGDVLIKGQGTGNLQNFQIGTRLYGGSIKGTNITVDAIGSIRGVSSSNWGLSLEGFTIEGSGIISLTGLGGRAGSSNSDANQVGVEIRRAMDNLSKHSQVKATGNGTILINGIGGSGAFAEVIEQATGIRIEASQINPILSENGDITLIGTSGYSGRGPAISIGSPIASTNGVINFEGFQSTAGTLNLNGNIEIKGTIATDGDINITTPGAVTQTAAITATNLELSGTGTFTLTNTSNNVGTIAGGTLSSKLGSLSYVDSNELTIGALTNPGIIASGKINIQTLTNNLNLNSNVVTDNTATDAIILNAGKSASIGTTTDGDIIVSGTPSVTTGTNGIAKLFSGTNASSTGLTSLVGGNGNTRYGYDENSTIFSPVLVNGNNYAIYRATDPTCEEILAITVQPIVVSDQVCQNTTAETISLTSTASNYSIQWYSNSSNSYIGATLILGATSNSYSLPTTTVGTKYYFAELTSSVTPCAVNTQIVSQTVTPALGSINFISGTANLASDATTATYSVSPVSGATSYIWNVPAGMTLTSQTGPSISVALAGSFTNGTVSVYALNNCGVTQTRTFYATKLTGGIDFNVTGESVLCSNTTETYTATTIADGIYNWTVPIGATIVSGQGTNSISVTAGANFTSGNIKATCVASQYNYESNYAVAGVALPSFISGPSNVCGLSTTTYSVENVSGTTYVWSLPSGMTVVGADNTASINVSISGTINGSITVQAQNDCGLSTRRRFTVNSAPILGGINGANRVCGAVQVVLDSQGNITGNTALNSYTYSVAAVSDADSYTWTVPTGATLVSGQGTTSITVSYNLATFESGTISVQAVNSTCGAGPERNLSVSTVTGTISGPTSLCGLTTVTYSV